MVIKVLKCRSCKQEFEPLYRDGLVLSRLCIKCLIEKKRTIDKRQQKRELKAQKDKLKTHSEWLKILEKVFNEYIRLRDKGDPCISCGQPYGTFTESAGHFFTVGAYPNLRFNEDNVHLQCWWNCNKNKSGNIAEYLPNLINKIGIDRYNKLLEARKEPLKLSIEEIKEQIVIYKNKVKQLKTQ